MRLMWLWVFLYAVIVGLILLILGAFAASGPTGAVTGIRKVVGSVCGYVTLGGFLVCFAGMIFLLIRRTVAAGRVVSLIGLGFYYIAAFGIFLAAFMSQDSSFEIPNMLWLNIPFMIFFAVVVGLPAFFITRTLIRAQKAERGET